MGKLVLGDIADMRAYEREREEFRQKIIEIKRTRRVSVGPIVTVSFENRDTVRFQVQEMARAERMSTDEQIQHELDVYNPLIPEKGHLSATLFVELTTEEDLRLWLPRLVGIERALEVRIGSPSDPSVDVFRSETEPAHQSALTREEITASVHYISFAVPEAQWERFESGPVTIATDHPAYREETLLSAPTRSVLAHDLRHGG